MKWSWILTVFLLFQIITCKGPEGPAGLPGEDGETFDWTSCANSLTDDVYLLGIIPALFVTERLRR